MPDLKVASFRYDRQTIILHWLTVVLVVSLWVLGQTIDWFPKGNPRVFARSTHITLGVVLALVLVTRVSWRLGAKAVHLPPAGEAWLDRIATATHWLLYGLLFVSAALGVANALVRGDTIFNLFKIQALDPTNKGLIAAVGESHALAANTLLAVAALHAAAALVHHFVWEDEVLRRMLLTK